MMESKAGKSGMGPRRHIGPIGTGARIALGLVLVGYGVLGGHFIFVHGRLKLDVEWLAAGIGLVAFPLVLLALQWLRLRKNRGQLMATGSIETYTNIAVFALLASTASIPAIAFLGFATFIFYGTSMLIAAVRGYAGCEVLAASNWLLGREDQVGCLVLSPVDEFERRSRLRAS